ncbi:CHAT domain-containing protein [Streptomyces parvulus]|uniref:CHAT domain-containing protein n=1 Tax=Streptomyces parvulus TaxID=146923 RepID=UPI0033A58718
MAEDDSAERGLKEIADRLRRRTRSDSLDLFERIRILLKDTGYPMLFDMAQAQARGADRTAMAAEGERAFATARTAREDGRRRLCVLHLSRAVAHCLLAGDMQMTSTSLGNLGMQLSELGRLRLGTAVQQTAAELKRLIGAEPANVARSLMLIALNRFRQGAYADCLHHLQQAERVLEPNAERRDLADRARRAGELRLRFERTLRTGEAESAEPVLTLAADAARARAAGDRGAEMRALFEAAEQFHTRLTMNAEAALYAAAAADLAADAADPLAHARALLLAGSARMECGEFRDAQDAFEAGVTVLRGVEAGLLEIELDACLALVLSLDGALDAAHGRIDMLLEKAARLPMNEGLQDGYARIGGGFKRMDDLAAAIKIFTAAGARLYEADMRNEGAFVLVNGLADCFLSLHQSENAIKVLDHALQQPRDGAHDAPIAHSHLHMARAYVLLNDTEQAQQALDRAEPYLSAAEDSWLDRYAMAVRNEVLHLLVTRTVSVMAADTKAGAGSPGQEASVRLLRERVLELSAPETTGQAEELVRLSTELGSALDRANREHDARQAFLLAFRTTLKWGIPQLQGLVLQNYGVLRARYRHAASARRIFRAALRQKDLHAGGTDRFSSLIGIAQADMALGRQPDSDWTELAESELDRRPPDERAVLLLVTSHLHEGAGRLQEAADNAFQALDHLREHGPADDRTRALNAAAGLALRLGRFEEAEQYAGEALDVVEASISLHIDDEPQEWRTVGNRATELKLLALAHGGLERAGDALHVLEMSKVRTLLRRHGLWQVRRPAAFPAELAQREDDILISLKALDYFAPGGSRAIPLSRETLMHDLRSQAREFWGSLPEPWQDYGALRLGRPGDPRALAADTGAHFVVLFPAAAHTLAWHVTPDGVVRNWSAIPLSAAECRRAVHSVRRALKDNKPVPRRWAAFSEVLTSSWLAHVPPGETVCFVPSGALLELPFALLRADNGHLVDRNAVVCLPALSLLAYFDQARHTSPPVRAVVLGDSLGDLPGARKEAREIADRLDTTAFLGPQVRQLVMEGALRGCNLLHVSGHARFDATDPERSGFVLADGSVFSARDALGNRLDAELAVLSGCDSGRLDWAARDTLTGVSAGLLASGFRSIVATSWPIPDKPTRMLCRAFYTNLLDEGMTLAQALRYAQMQLSAHRRFSEPYFWGAFRVFGDWRWSVQQRAGHHAGGGGEGARN